MDIQPQNKQPISDDQDLAKVLSGVAVDDNQTAGQPQATDTTASAVPAPTPDQPAEEPAAPELPDLSQFGTVPSETKESSTPQDETSASLPKPASGLSAGAALPEPTIEPTEKPEEKPATEPVAPVLPPVSDGLGSSDLGGIKKDVLNELRPLVGKLNLKPEEMFDTYLLLLRSTDDKALIEPAHAAAQAITDESRKAQALLEIIKEIDYLDNLGKAPSPSV